MLDQPVLGPGETLLSTVRHGLTQLNRDKRVGGRIDVPLIDEGRKQAQEAAATFAGTPFDVIVSSPLQRSIETASTVTGLPPEAIEVDELSTERSFGGMEGIDPAEVPRRFPEVRYHRVGHVGYSLNPPGGEPFDELQARARRFLEGLLARHGGKRIVVFSHQNFLQQLHGVLLGLDPIGALQRDILNCELNRFHLAADGSLVVHDTVQLCATAARYPSF
ncbi:MAG: histidine phosphatase family protein [Actinomycetota bacterium]|nr:histidine phosphatase family protein [Actinomycetota bacterium]